VLWAWWLLAAQLLVLLLLLLLLLLVMTCLALPAFADAVLLLPAAAVA
jgi:hypothetical protein